MLVLSRRIGEQIVINGNIHVTVVAVQGNKVRLGVAAPPTVGIDRQEISERRREWASKPWQQSSAFEECRTPDLKPIN
jgi:carbon storage regulator